MGMQGQNPRNAGDPRAESVADQTQRALACIQTI